MEAAGTKQRLEQVRSLFWLCLGAGQIRDKSQVPRWLCHLLLCHQSPLEPLFCAPWAQLVSV